MYETLKELGITEPEEIEKYSLHQEGDEDILKIYFKKKKGALFAHSTKFRHGRAKKVILTDSGKHLYKEISEISPTMLKAVKELDQIVQHDQNIQDSKQQILNDIEHLEKVLLRKLRQLREDVERLE